MGPDCSQRANTTEAPPPIPAATAPQAPPTTADPVGGRSNKSSKTTSYGELTHLLHHPPYYILALKQHSASAYLFN